jgi:mono/diheme cytochrome c family protein
MARSSVWLAAVALAAAPSALAEEAVTNPFLGKPEAIKEGRATYRGRCYICHLEKGGRGPNLFASSLSDEQFLEIAINGRRTMPAFGTLMSPDEVWAVHAYVKSTDHYE